MKGIFANRSGLFQVSVLVLSMLVGSVLSVLCCAPLLLGNASAIEPDTIRMTQLITTMGTFLLPAVAAAYFFSDNICAYLSLKTLPSAKMAIATLIGMLLASPVISVTNILNQQMTFPDWMEPIQTWMRQQEEQAARFTTLLVQEKGISTFLYNLVVVAIAAAVTEELFFRGALQRIIARWTHNHHIVIWTAAFVFSAIHLQFFGFVPRLLMGAYFGYLLYWSKNIYLPVLAHFFNNTLALAALSSATLAENKILSQETTFGEIAPYAVAGLILFVLFVRPLKKALRSKVLLA